MADDDFGFAPPPFKAAEALVQLKRSLRELRTLTERGTCFEWKGLPAVTLAVDDTSQASEPDCSTATPSPITAQLARKPGRNPAWDTSRLKSGAEVRRWLDEVRLRIARWDDDD